MKRGGPLKRRTPLRQVTPLKQGESTLKRVPLQPRMSALENRAWHLWVEAVTRVGVCAVCKRGPKGRGAKRLWIKLDPHHVIPARAIRRYLRSYFSGMSGWQMTHDEKEGLRVRLLFNPENGVALCRDCHEAHECGAERVPRALVPGSAVRFAAQLGLGYLIDRLYPA